MGEWEGECETAVRVGRSEGNKADEWIEKVLPLNYPRLLRRIARHIIYIGDEQIDPTLPNRFSPQRLAILLWA